MAKATGTVLDRIWKKSVPTGLLFEARLFGKATREIEGYSGGNWVSLDKGGHVMGLDDNAKRVRLTCATNGCNVETDMRSATAGAFVASLNHAIWYFHDQGDLPMARFFEALWLKANNAWKRKAVGLDVCSIATYLD